MSDVVKKSPVVLCILDGWGINTDARYNAIYEGDTPNWDRFLKEYPNSRLQASGGDVGLPSGQMGNSEVGHMNIGAGRVVLQDLPRIDKVISEGKLSELEVFKELVSKLKSNGGVCHLMGLMSDGGVHSSQTHIVGLVKLLYQEGIAVKVHAFMDGRDTPPTSGAKYLADFEESVKGMAQVDTIIGRFYAMDRDSRWERVQQAYDLLVSGIAENTFDNSVEIVKEQYSKGVNDEFLKSSKRKGYDGFNDGDAILFANFRSDRVRELSIAFFDEMFSSFPRSKVVKFGFAVSMSEYSDALNKYYKVLFPSYDIANTLGEVASKEGKTQLRIAETEKYAHVTFFLNGGREVTYDGERRILIPSPRVATYDLKPEMSAPEVCDTLVTEINSGKHDLIVVNFANGDMVGHTGVMDAAIKAVECVDHCLGRLERVLQRCNGVMLLTADHGNAELMYDDKTQQPHTAHTTNPVPLILVNGRKYTRSLKDGMLSDLAPTVLELMRIKLPREMTGKSLL